MTSFSRQFAAVGAPVLLVLVASLQMFNSSRHGLSPWKGGGFGMFSTVDAPPLRSIRFQLLSDIGPVEVTPPESFQKLVLQATNFPTASNIEGLLDDVSRVDYSSPYPIPGVLPGDSVRTTGVAVEVARMIFDPDTRVIRMVQLRSDSVEYPDGARWIHAEEVEN